LLIILFTGVHFIAPYAILQPPRVSEKLKPEKLGLKSDKLSINVGEGINLEGYWIKSKEENPKGIIILIHGIGGCKEHFLGLADKLSKKGIESIVFDGRAHGKSGGKYTTYGHHEKEDISKIVGLIKEKIPGIKIGIWGNSLGGAISIQALEIEKRIEFGIIESTFTELDQIVYDYKKRILKVGIKSISNYALKRAGEIGGFNYEKIKPIESVKEIEQPIFLSHGEKDENINPKYGKMLYENLKSKEKEFVLVKGGGHFDLFEKGGKEYENKIMNFIDKNLK